MYVFVTKRFQDVEETHLKHMKEFLNTYADVLQTNHEQVGQVHIDFKRQCVDMTVEKLLEQFVQSKYTGFEKPGKARSYSEDFFFVSTFLAYPIDVFVNQV